MLIDVFEEYDEGNRMGDWRSASSRLKGESIQLIRQDFWSDPTLPFGDDEFSVCTCLDVVEHLPGHPLRQLGELRRILRPNGFMLLSGPNGVSFMKRLSVVAGRYPYSPFSHWVSTPYFEHYREYVRQEYEELLRLAGFRGVASMMSAAVTHARAANRYHKGRLGPLSPRLPLLFGLSAIEAAVPGLRHGVYAWGTA